ncbi:hypothetical protein [Arcobacter sp.]|uniref:hypothetical protein n=1 Tax=Arcobacter sp. TaxID=1872629 RepID=UPI003D0EBFE4
MYYDANNLYGGAMSSYLPTKDFKYSNEEWTKEKILKLKDDADKGYYFIVDLHYPENLHKSHNGYALCSENKSISNNLLSTKQSESRKETKIKKIGLFI